MSEKSIGETLNECKTLLFDAVNSDTTVNSVFSCLKFVDVFYEPDRPLDEKLSDMGFTKLQIYALITRYSMNINDQEFLTVPVINPYEYDGKELPQVEWVVKEMIPDGVSILAAPPKYHKSFFALQLAVSVCNGLDFLGFHTLKGDCLYFDLESNPRRPLNRLQKMYNTLDISGLHIITAQSGIRRLESGFEEDLEMLLVRFPNTKLVIIDVLQYITPLKAKDNIYSSDYDTINMLNALAIKYRISILAVHHTRKLKDESDPINNITGTTGLTGAVSTIIEILQEKRTNPSAVLLLTGNDIETRELAIKFDSTTLKWICEGDASDVAFKTFVNRPESQCLTHLMSDKSNWIGSAADLSAFAAGLNFDITPADFGRFLKFNKPDIIRLGLDIVQHRNSSSRTITITHHVNNNPS